MAVGGSQKGEQRPCGKWSVWSESGGAAGEGDVAAGAVKKLNRRSPVNVSESQSEGIGVEQAEG